MANVQIGNTNYNADYLASNPGLEKQIRDAVANGDSYGYSYDSNNKLTGEANKFTIKNADGTSYNAYKYIPTVSNSEDLYSKYTDSKGRFTGVPLGDAQANQAINSKYDPNLLQQYKDSVAKNRLNSSVPNSLNAQPIAINSNTPSQPNAVAPSSDDALYKTAYDAVVQARATGKQSDIDIARKAVDSLKGTGGEFAIGEFSKQLDSPQQSINIASKQNGGTNDYLTTATDLATSSAKSEQEARDAIIKARLDGQITEEQANIALENSNFTKNTKQTREDIYNAQENNRAQGIQRGIQYSQQQQAIESGTSMAGEKMIQQAQADRDMRIKNIQDKINSLKTGASYELQSSQATADAEVAKAKQDALNINQQRQWQVEDANTAYERELNLKNVDKQTQIDLFNLDDASKVKFFNMEEASKEKFFKMDEASKEKFFNMDTDRQKMFFDLNEASKEKFWKLDAQQQEKMFGMNADLQKEMFNLSSAQQVKMLGLENANQVALANMSVENQKKMMDYSATLDQKALDAKVKATADQAKATTLSNYLMSSPTFKAYPSVKDIGKNPKIIEELSNWMTATGVPMSEQNKMIKGQISSTWWDNLIGKTAEANKLVDIITSK